MTILQAGAAWFGTGGVKATATRNACAAAWLRPFGNLRVRAAAPIQTGSVYFDGRGTLQARVFGPMQVRPVFSGQGTLFARAAPEKRAKRPPRLAFTDIRIVNRSSLNGVWADWLLRDGKLDETQVLANVVKVALMTDRRADAKEILPDPDSTDRRGWWGDFEAGAVWDGWDVGCKNWLLTRAKIAPAESQEGSTLVRAEAYTRAALQPLIDRRMCSQIDVRATRSERQRIDVLVKIYRGPQEEIELQFQGLWDEITG